MEQANRPNTSSAIASGETPPVTGCALSRLGFSLFEGGDDTLLRRNEKQVLCARLTTQRSNRAVIPFAGRFRSARARPRTVVVAEDPNRPSM